MNSVERTKASLDHDPVEELELCSDFLGTKTRHVKNAYTAPSGNMKDTATSPPTLGHS